jgi:hypothetical protein
MPEGEPSAMDYLRWLSTEISGLPDMFGGVNENFITAVVEGALVMAGSLLISTLYKTLPPLVGLTFYLWSVMYVEPCTLCRKSGGSLLIMIMCWILFTPGFTR